MDILIIALKILLIIFQIALSLLLLILFLILVIIFANAKYQFKSNTIDYYVDNDNIRKCNDFKFKLTYLFSAIKVFCDKKDDKIRILVKVFWKEVYKDVIINSLFDDIIYKNKKAEEKNFTTEIAQNSEEKSDSNIEPTDNINNEAIENTELKTETYVKVEEVDKKTLEKSEEIKGSLEKETKKVKKTKKIKEIKSSKEKQVSFIDTLKNKDFIVKLFKQTIKFLKALKPSKFITRIKIGFEDPSLTGKVIGAAYTIKGVTGLDLNVEGNFQEEIKPDIFIYMKGKLSIFKLVKPYLFIIWLFIKFKLKQILGLNKGE